MKKTFVLVSVLLLFAFVLAACGGDEGETVEVEVTRIVEVEVTPEGGAAAAPVATGGTLDTIRERGVLICANNANLPGFGFLEEDGSFSGFDWDYCRAVAVAALGDANLVEGRPTTATERFPVLQSGEADVLIRNTTYTTNRDTALGFDFTTTTFYDGQGMMVRRDSGITELEGLEGGTVCVQQGTTTEENLADQFRLLGINSESVVFPDANSTREAYDEGRCDGFTTDKSGLIASQTQLTVPEDHVILEATMSKEPLGPLTRHGDNAWQDIVMWTVNCTIQAEELGITSENIDEFMSSDDPFVLGVLGVEGSIGTDMGIDNDFCAEIIRQVGNYEEIYNRNLGPDTPYNVPRGLNSLYTEGGLLYSPPMK